MFSFLLAHWEFPTTEHSSLSSHLPYPFLYHQKWDPNHTYTTLCTQCEKELVSVTIIHVADAKVYNLFRNADFY